jgi:predicted dehydrogenase
MAKIKWGIIGCGVIAPHHADSVVDSEYAELAAVCDVDVEKGGRDRRGQHLHPFRPAR